MKDFNNDEKLKELLKSVYEPATPSPELKERLFQSLAGEVSLPSRLPRVLVPIAAVIIAVVIGYGVWLSLNPPLS